MTVRGKLGGFVGRICVVVALVGLVYGVMTHTPERDSTLRFLLAYGPPFIALLFGLTLLQLKGERADALGLALLSALFSLYLAETGLMLFGTADDSGHPECREAFAPLMCNIALEMGREFDTRSKLAVVEDLEARGERPVPSSHPSGVLARLEEWPVLPLGGISDALTVYCNETGEYVVYVSDEHGFRNPRGLHDQRLSVALVGDSQTQGACVREEETIADIVRQTYPMTLNLGSDGNGPLFVLATIKEYLTDSQPGTVFWIFTESNDLSDLEGTKNVPELLAYLEPGHKQDLRSRQAEIDAHWRSSIAALRARAVAKRDSFVSASHSDGAVSSGPRGRLDRSVLQFILLRRLRNLTVRAFAPSGMLRRALRDDRYPANWELLREVAEEARRTVEGWGGQLVLVYLPALKRFARPRWEQAPRERVLETFEAAGVDVIDATSAFAEQKDPLALWPFRGRGPAHLSPKGYRIAADLMLAHLHRDPKPAGQPSS